NTSTTLVRTRVLKWDFLLVRVGAIDVVETDGDLRHDLERPLPCFEHLGIDWVAQRCNQSIDAALHFLDDQFLRWRLRSLKNFEIVPVLTQTVLRRIADARRRKYAKTFLVRHNCRRI